MTDNSDFYYENIDCSSTTLSEDEKMYCTLDPDSHVSEDAYDVVASVLSTIYGLIGILAVIMIIVGGIQMATSKGSPEKLTRAKSTIFYSVIGLIITFSAFGITTLIVNSVAPQNTTTQTAQQPTQSEEEQNGSPIRRVKYIRVTKSISIAIGQEAKIATKIIPTDATHKNLTYTANDSTIATVDASGIVRGLAAGETTILIASEDGPYTEIRVSVIKPDLVKGITLSNTSVIVEIGGTVNVVATVTPANAANKKLEWTSADTATATVTQSGIITGKKIGNTTITISSTDGTNIKTTVNVSVVAAGTAPQSPTTTASGYKTQGSLANKKAPASVGFTPSTKTIVKNHMSDKLTYNTYESFMNSHGGYNNYIKSLGGIFEAYAGKSKKFKVKTAADFQAAAEYAWGLWTIWGVDYDNGISSYHKWGNNIKSGGTPDGFYVGSGKRYVKAGTTNKAVDEMLQNKNKSRPNCNYGVDSFQKKTNLKYFYSADVSNSKKNSKVGKITNTGKLQVGDHVHFFSGSKWKHIAIVGEVYSDYVVLYDAGGRFMNNRQYKYKVKRGTRSMNGTYSNYGTNWYALRVWNINQDINLAGL